MYSKILVALDGSEHSLAGGEITLALAQNLGSEVIAGHIYDAQLHSTRFQEMEPALPDRYQKEDELSRLRGAHDELIFEGFEALSKGYMERYVEEARKRGVSVTQIHKEGRNYVELLRIAEERKVNLIVLGAQGLGKSAEISLGSTSGRVLRLARCDVLIARCRLTAKAVLVGIDGSEEALTALRKAAVWTRAHKKSLRLSSVFDPNFHTQVFKTMASALSPERQEEVGLSKQASLHDQIIDEGLGDLYQGFIDQAQSLSQEIGIVPETSVIQGKIPIALVKHAQQVDAGLIVLGRYGHHRNDSVRIGSNSEAVARLAQTNVLVAEPLESSQITKSEKTPSLQWEEKALAQLERIPPFARPMAKRGIENDVLAKKKTKVTLEDVIRLARRLGRGDRMKQKDD